MTERNYNVGINITSKSDDRGFRDAIDAERRLQRETEKVERSFQDFDNETEALNQRLKEYERRVQAVIAQQRELGQEVNRYDAASVVRSYERESYELGKRREVAKADWQERQTYLRGEYDERQRIRDMSFEQRDADRRGFNRQEWDERREIIKTERDEREKIRKTQIENSIAERKAARDSEWAWRRRTQAVKEYATEGLAIASAAVAAFAKESIESFAEFDTNIRQLSTISDGGGSALSTLTEDALILSRELKVLPQDFARAAYQAQSLGSANPFDDLATAQKAAVAGNADLTESLEAGLKTLNAYPDQMYDLTRVYDLFFSSIELGAIEMSDLASGISEVTSVAGESGTRLEDVLAALVTMTKQGDDFNEALELSSLLLTQLGTSGTAAATAFEEANAGQSYREFIAQGGNLAEALKIIEDQALATGKSVGEMLSGASPFFRDTQAARAAAELTGIHLDTMTESIDAMTNSAGRMGEAYSIMEEGAQRDLDSLASSWEILKIRTGEYLFSLEPVQWALENVSTQLYALSGGLVEETSRAIAANAAAFQDLNSLAAEAERLQQAEEETRGTNLVEPVRDRIREIVAGLAEQTESVEEFRDVLIATFGPDAVSGYGEFEEITIGAQRLGGLAYNLAEAQERLAENTGLTQQALMEQAQALELNADAYGNIDREMEMLNRRMNHVAEETVENVREIETEILKVLDGDTIRAAFDGVIADVRLNNINTPETAKEWLGKAGMPFGDEALAFTQEYLMQPDIKVVQTGEHDPYGRILAEIIGGDSGSLEAGLVSAGLALPLPIELSGDEEATMKLKELAIVAAETGQGFFSRSEVAAAYLNEEINSMDELMQMYDTLAAADAAYYSSYIGYLDQAFTEIEEVRQALRGLAVDKLLAESDISQVEGILDFAINLGVLTEEEAELRLAFANSATAIEEQTRLMGEAESVTDDMYETLSFLTTGLFESREEAQQMAEWLSGPLAESFLESAEQGGTLEEVLDRIGLSINSLPDQKTVKFISDTSQWNPPSGTGPDQYKIGAPGSQATRLSQGGLVTGGIPFMDSVPAYLMPGEFVINQSAASKLGQANLEALNAGRSAGSIVLNQTINVSGGSMETANAAHDATKRAIMDAARSLGIKYGPG